MTGPSPLSPAARDLRERLLDGLWPRLEQGAYIGPDRFVGTCPACGNRVGVHFTGNGEQAALDCRGGCDEGRIARLLGLGVRP